MRAELGHDPDGLGREGAAVQLQYFRVAQVGHDARLADDGLDDVASLQRTARERGLGEHELLHGDLRRLPRRRPDAPERALPDHVPQYDFGRVDEHERVRVAQVPRFHRRPVRVAELHVELVVRVARQRREADAVAQIVEPGLPRGPAPSDERGGERDQQGRGPEPQADQRCLDDQSEARVDVVPRLRLRGGVGAGAARRDDGRAGRGDAAQRLAALGLVGPQSGVLGPDRDGRRVVEGARDDELEGPGVAGDRRVWERRRPGSDFCEFVRNSGTQSMRSYYSVLHFLTTFERNFPRPYRS